MGSKSSKYGKSTDPRLPEKLYFPEGIPAFEHLKFFSVVQKQREYPFIWLQADEDSEIAFLTIDPFIVVPDYNPEIADEFAAMLEITKPEDALLLCIVNIKAEQGATINLISPITINWKTGNAHQILLNNYQEYSIKHKIGFA